jgi:hypothetical protein
LSRPDVQARHVPHVTNGLIVTRSPLRSHQRSACGLVARIGAGRRSSWPKGMHQTHRHPTPQSGSGFVPLPGTAYRGTQVFEQNHKPALSFCGISPSTIRIWPVT